ncbi:MAG: hypothetical protein JSV77_10460 [Dehalococcoidales bacterium]|nr:MAG: hypothetical protein JSV77_10460 [Dehalococcoidales bacterium]
MKKLIMLSLVIILAISIAANPVLADSKGAVKQPIRIGWSGPEVGWVVINSSANEMLEVVVHLQKAIQETDLAAGLWRTDVPGWGYLGEGRMTTNVQGNTSVNFKCQIPEDLVNSSSVNVCLCIYTLNPTTLIYWSPLFDVPIK